MLSRAWSSVVLALFAFATLVSCDKVPLTAPTDSTVLLVVSTTVVPVNGTADVIASVIEKGGTAVQNGTIVTFTSSFGTVEPREARTDVAGKAYAKFIGSSQSGVAKIGAFSGGAKATEVEVKVGAAAAENVVLRAEPAVVSPNGGTVDLIATVTDASGNPLPGAPVIFSTDFGSLESNSVTSNGDGRAQTRLTTNRKSAVKARAGAKEGTATVEVVTLPTVAITIPTGAVPTVGIPLSFTVTLPATLTAPLQNVFIEFGDGDSLNLGAISGSAGFTHTYNQEGGFTVRATAVDVLGQRGTSSIAFVVTRSIPGVTLTATPSSGAVGTQVFSFTVGATAAAGAPQIVSVQVVIEGTGQVVYSATAGGTFTRSFGAAGVYVLRATATDRSGAVGTASTSVTVF